MNYGLKDKTSALPGRTSQALIDIARRLEKRFASRNPRQQR
jgi:hypothetical protein